MTAPALLVELTRSIPAPAERVFDAWLDPTLMARFLCPAPGVTVKDMRVDPVVGGAFSLTMVAGEAMIPIHGQYTVLERATAMQFTWLSSRSGPDSVVELRFEAEGQHTRLTLRHLGLPDMGSRNDHEGGWGHILGLLGGLLG